MRIAVLNGAVAVALLIPGLLAAQDTDSTAPRLENARLEKRALAGQLTAEAKRWAEQAAQPQWLGYAVPQIAGARTVCCGNYNGSWREGCGTCRMESGHNENNVTSSQSGTMKLEGPRYLVVLFRAENRYVMKIRAASDQEESAILRRPRRYSTAPGVGCASRICSMALPASSTSLPSSAASFRRCSSAPRTSPSSSPTAPPTPA